MGFGFGFGWRWTPDAIDVSMVTRFCFHPSCCLNSSGIIDQTAQQIDTRATLCFTRYLPRVNCHVSTV